MDSFVIAVDIGTTSTKVLAVLPSGNVLAQHQVYYPTAYPKPGFAEQDANKILAAVLAALKVLESNIDLSNAIGISFSSAMHSVLAVNEKGEALTPLIIWADTRSSAQAKKLNSTALGLSLHGISGTPIHPMSPLCKLMWMREFEPNVFTKAHKFISIKEFVWYHLTGEFCVDYSIASATGLFDIHQKEWSKSALEQAEVSAQQLSKPVPVTYQAFLATKILPNYLHVPLIIGASDGCLAQLGSDAMQAGILTITLGTSGAVRRSATRKLNDPSGRLFNYLLTDDVTIAGGATNNGTAVMDWFMRELAQPEEDLSTTIAKVCAKIDAGSDGLLALPFLQGERAPIYNPDARGVFFNIGMQHTRQHFAHALLESICYELKWIAESVELVLGPSDKIVVSGGITHFADWVQMLADVFNRELVVSSGYDASALGAAHLAFHSLDVSFNISVQSQAKFKPNEKRAQFYTQGYGQFKQVYEALHKLF